MKESLEIQHNFNVKPSVIYDAWLNSTQHSKMTGGLAKCSNEIGGNFTAWDGYIKGKNIDLKSNKEIIQRWRTSEFDKNDEDSKLIIRFKEIENGTELTLIHNNIPEGQTQYKKGWIDHYFKPMENYFDKLK